MGEYSVPPLQRMMRAIGRPLFRGIFHLLSDVSIQGLENVPEEGPYLIAINHVSLYEAPFVMSFWPVPPEAVGASDLWERPGQSLLVRLYGGIPLRRGQFDRQVIDQMIDVLKSGRPLLIAPEGRRSHEPGMRRGQPGVAYLTEKVQVPIVPVGITGATDDFLKNALQFKRPHIQMTIGRPIHLPPIEAKGEERRKARQENVDRIMMEIAKLLPEEYRGVYAERKEPEIQTQS